MTMYVALGDFNLVKLSLPPRATGLHQGFRLRFGRRPLSQKKSNDKPPGKTDGRLDRWAGISHTWNMPRAISPPITYHYCCVCTGLRFPPSFSSFTKLSY